MAFLISFYDWLFEININNPRVENQWGPVHIATLLASILLIVVIGLVGKFVKNKKAFANAVIITLVSLIAFFELSSRIVYFLRMYFLEDLDMDNYTIWWILLPKPWCAVACWSLMASVIIRKKFFYNYASLSAFLCAVVFFAYPGVGYNNMHLMFSNIYSICTHMLLLITSMSLITLKFTEFRVKTLWKVVLCFGITLLYGYIETLIPALVTVDPMYFMPNGDIQLMFGLTYPMYLLLYFGVITVYFAVVYLIADRKTIFKHKTKAGS